MTNSKKNGIFYNCLSSSVAICLSGAITYVYLSSNAFSAELINEPVHACVIARDVDLTADLRTKFAQCLGWQTDLSSPICHGHYKPLTVTPLASADEVRIKADKVSFFQDKRSTLSGNVEVQQNQRVLNAQTAYLYRDVNTNQITKIELLGEVRFMEPDRLMIARKAVINPQDHSGKTEDVIYRFKTDRSGAVLPAWGRAGFIQRFANKNYLLGQATYTTCAPQDKAWDIKAESITLDDAKAKAVARNAVLRIREWPVFYAPYLSFPTNHERKSGFLMPILGYSNEGGFDLGVPYYWNMAPNYDLTLVPHIYTERGVMLGGDFRFLNTMSVGSIRGSILPQDRAFKRFIEANEGQFPSLSNLSTNRWSVGILESTQLSPNMRFNLAFNQVSDSYYFQDFSANLAAVTERQLLRQADLTYTTDHWLFRAMGQSYQTLQPINEIPTNYVYERLPQLSAYGFYYDLPFNANFRVLGQYDQFFWPTNPWYINTLGMPQGPRLHLNPILTVPFVKPWGYTKPSFQFVENYYEVQGGSYLRNGFNHTLPRLSVDNGLFFDRESSLFGSHFTQTLEPRLFYLYVPFQNQVQTPVYDAGYMIFNYDQLFRTNRFSGYDRIGDANQLSYALTSRWLSSRTGREVANFSIGQMKYFVNRRVQLCQSITGECLDDPYAIGYLSPTFGYSPVASRAVLFLNPIWRVMGDYVWDPAKSFTNNADLNLVYQPAPDKVFSIGYGYLVNGDMTQVQQMGTQDNSLNQGTIAFAWPLSEKWSTVGAYSHNISKNYSMMSLFGVQYDNCCWAMRLLGGRTFKSLSPGFEPQYNNNVYFQILLKGLGSVANNDPYNILSTYIPTYRDPFKR